MSEQHDPLVSLAQQIFGVLDEAGLSNTSEELKTGLAEQIANDVELNLVTLTAKRQHYWTSLGTTTSLRPKRQETRLQPF